MELSSPSWVNLALQVPLALVIVFLVIKFLDFTQKQTNAFMSYLAEQRKLDRDQISEALGRLADEIKNANTSIVKSSYQEMAQLAERVDKVIENAKEFQREARYERKS